MINLNTYVLDTLADTLGHEPTHADVDTLQARAIQRDNAGHFVRETFYDRQGVYVGMGDWTFEYEPRIPAYTWPNLNADLHATLNAREATRALRAALHALRTELAQS